MAIVHVLVPAQRYVFAVSNGEAEAADARQLGRRLRALQGAPAGRADDGHGRLPEHAAGPRRARLPRRSRPDHAGGAGDRGDGGARGRPERGQGRDPHPPALRPRRGARRLADAAHLRPPDRDRGAVCPARLRRDGDGQPARSSTGRRGRSSRACAGCSPRATPTA